MSAIVHARVGSGPGKKALPDATRQEARRWISRVVAELARTAGLPLTCDWSGGPNGEPLALVSAERRAPVAIEENDFLHAALGNGAARDAVRKALRAALDGLRGGTVARRRVASIQVLD